MFRDMPSLSSSDLGPPSPLNTISAYDTATGAEPREAGRRPDGQPDGRAEARLQRGLLPATVRRRRPLRLRADGLQQTKISLRQRLPTYNVAADLADNRYRPTGNWPRKKPPTVAPVGS